MSSNSIQNVKNSAPTEPVKAAALSDRARPAEMLNDNNIAPPINVKRQLKFPSKSEVVGSKGVKLLMKSII